MYYTYVLFCEYKEKDGGKFYVGSTSDLKKRILEHRAGTTRTTQKFDIIRLVYYEACLNKTDAIKRELQLKTGFGRGYINKRIESYLKGE
jgi:putative endonuclease